MPTYKTKVKPLPKPLIGGQFRLLGGHYESPALHQQVGKSVYVVRTRGLKIPPIARVYNRGMVLVDEVKLKK